MVHCPTCDAGLRFEIETQQMACDHCGNRFDIEATSDNEKFDAKGHQVIDLYVFVCPDCGAELAVNSENDAVGFCPYCGGSSMLFDRVRQTWVPDGIIPFKVTKEQCKSEYVNEVRRHPFVSRKYRDPELVETFRGIYMPYWQFIGKMKTPYKVQNEETVEGSSEDKRIRRVYEQWYEPDFTVTGLSHDASAEFDDHISERLAPYREKDVEPFHPGYLSGFYAEVGNMDQETYSRYLETSCQDLLAAESKIKMTDLEKRNIRTDIKSLTNVFYPVWFMSYRRGDKISYAAVNGATGRVSADLPLSPLRIIASAVALTLVIFAAINLLWSFAPSIKAADVLTLCAVISFASICFLNASCFDTLSQSLSFDEALFSFSGKHAKSDDPPRRRGTIATLFLDQKRTTSMAFVSALAIVGSVFVMTDGSYQGTIREAGIFMCLIGYVGLLAWATSQVRFEFTSKNALNESRSSQLENGIVEVYSKYRPFFIILKTISCASCLVAAYLGITGSLTGFAYYAVAIVLAVEVLAYAALQIAFQAKVAERKPPQMSKKGAFYDTH